MLQIICILQSFKGNSSHLLIFRHRPEASQNWLITWKVTGIIACISLKDCGIFSKLTDDDIPTCKRNPLYGTVTDTVRICVQSKNIRGNRASLTNASFPDYRGSSFLFSLIELLALTYTVLIALQKSPQNQIFLKTKKINKKKGVLLNQKPLEY